MTLKQTSKLLKRFQSQCTKTKLGMRPNNLHENKMSQCLYITKYHCSTISCNNNFDFVVAVEARNCMSKSLPLHLGIQKLY